MRSIQGKLLLRLLLICSCARAEDPVSKRCFQSSGKDQKESEDLADFDGDCAVGKGQEATLLASLLDGSLVAIGKASGKVAWTLADEPAVKSPYDPSKPVLPAFLPDPKDGALYMMGASLEDPLQKLPWTIPQLVAASPSRTSDGILYSGKKVDTWVSVSRQSGVKKGALSYEGCMRGEDEEQCPVREPGTVLLGRTEYNIMMYDTRTRDRKWNITYYDYSSSLGGIDVSADYELAHFTDSSSGKLVTLDKVSGAVQWETELASPVVAMYQLAAESIAAVPFTSVSPETLTHLMDQFLSRERREAVGETKLFPTLYVGEHEHGLFAVPSLVDEQTMTISPSRDRGNLLLEGPQEMGVKVNKEQRGEDMPRVPGDTSSVLVFGYYKVPEYSSVPGRPQITTSQTLFPFEVAEIKVIPAIEGPEQNRSVPAPSLPYDPEELSRGLSSLTNASFIFSAELPKFMATQMTPMLIHTLAQVDNKEMKAAALVIFLTVAWFVRFVKTQFKQWEKNFGEAKTSNNSNSVSRSSTSSSVTSYEVTASPIELPDGNIKVGNITFNPGQVLGKGCEGTFVYKGRFDGREVAVKRVLAACFSIADREVELLRESDEHPHVVRYFCMEQCRQFRYIALELCVATLQDWVEGRYSMHVKMDVTAVFRQAVQGLAHLHGLDIAHRDIKPANVLLSAPGRRGEVRAMISDFGLCKKLKVGRMSFSRRSGVAGTEGWIAPEMLLGNRSTTCLVDIFSMGCVYYYMSTGGKHPFGTPFHRQANILSGQKELGLLDTEAHHTQISLLETMLAAEPTDRPPCSALLRHPVFWTREKILAFLQEVSDRVDKEEEGSVVLSAVERNGKQVTQGDWHLLLEPAVREDLRKHRSYRGRSVRDLLRAIRNKKHHYRELTEEAKALYGEMPGEFADYWTSRFPRLVMHSYKAMQCCKLEPNFEKYYYKDFDFVPVVKREQGDIHPSDVDLLSPGFLNNPTGSPQTPSPHSVVSSWSQLSLGSRLSADSSYRDDLLLPCSRDPSSEEGSDSKDFSEEESELVKDCQELDPSDIMPEKEVGQREVDGEELKTGFERADEEHNESLAINAARVEELSIKVEKEVLNGHGGKKSDDSEAIENHCVTPDEKETDSQTPVEETKELTQIEVITNKENAPVLNIMDLDTVIEDVTPKKKNKKRRKHAKKKKPGTLDLEEDPNEEEDISPEV